MAQVDSDNTTAMPANDAGALYLPTDVTPDQLFQAIGRLRKEARDEIDRLIRFLDKTDYYVSRELEDSNDDEPSLGWNASGSQGAGHCGGTDDLESETEHDEESDPAEPSLGSVGHMHFDQTGWAAGGRRDLELDGGESGIGDYDGLMEQVGTRDWQQGGQG